MLRLCIVHLLIKSKKVSAFNSAPYSRFFLTLEKEKINQREKGETNEIEILNSKVYMSVFESKSLRLSDFQSTFYVASEFDLQFL